VFRINANGEPEMIADLSGTDPNSNNELSTIISGFASVGSTLYFGAEVNSGAFGNPPSGNYILYRYSGSGTPSIVSGGQLATCQSAAPTFPGGVTYAPERVNLLSIGRL
jgi:hypothetical protein